MKKIQIASLLLLAFALNIQAQTDTTKVKKYQAKAPKTQTFGAEAFGKSNKTVIRWLGDRKSTRLNSSHVD